MPPYASDEDLAKAVEAHKALGATKAAQALGIPRTTLSSRVEIAARRGLMGTGPVLPGFEIKSTSTQLGPDGELQREWIKQAPAAGEQYAPPDGHVVKGESALVGADGRVIQRWVKTREGEVSPQQWVDTIREAFAAYEAPRAFVPAPHASDNIATVFPVADSHFGLYAYGPEAGEDFDLSIADKLNRETFASLVDATPNSGTAVIVGLGDLLHADDPTNRTAKSGHALDVDTRHSKVRQTALLFLIFCVEKAKERHGKVIIRILPGNHDEVTAGAISLALWAWFREDDRVEVDIDPSRFWWWRFGSNLLGATHGDMAKMKDLPMIMAATRPEDWGATKYRAIFTGHIHHQSAMEIGGVIVESFQTTAAKDVWHSSMGYRAGRSMQAIVLHSERGEVGRHRVNV
jgi:hypothetical protein